jgi:hypothetical protein
MRLLPGTVLDIADTYTWGKSRLELAADDYHQRTLPWFHAGLGGADPDWSFALASDPKLLGLALSVPLLALLLLVSLRIELQKGLFSPKAQVVTAAWSARRSEGLSTLHRAARYLAATVMRAGPVPRHVAFIMDGNRRWAKTNGLKTHSGHTAGYEAMCAVLEHCKDLGVEVVTVYAFSIENFKRDPAGEFLARPICLCQPFDLGTLPTDCSCGFDHRGQLLDGSGDA